MDQPRDSEAGSGLRLTRRAFANLSRGTLLAAAVAPISADVANPPSGAGPAAGASDVYRPESFMLGSDAGHGIAFQRMIDRMEARGHISARLGQALYDVSDQQIQIHTAIQMVGDGNTESGLEADEGSAGRSFTEAMRGTRIRANCRKRPQFLISGGGARGAFFDRILFSQSHPTPGRGWAAVPYDYLFDVSNTGGMVEFGTIGLIGINKGIRANSGRFRYLHLYGQMFTSGIFVDNLLDTPSFGFLRLYGLWSNDRNVAAYQMENLDVMTIGRCDGLFMDSVFAIAARRGIRLIDTGLGSATKLRIGAAYLDFTRTGMSVEAANVTAEIDSFQHTGEDASQTGTAQPGSSGLEVTGGGGEIDFCLFRSERISAAALAISANTTVNIDRPRWGLLNGAPPIINTGGVAVLLGRREISDGTGQPLDERLVARQTNNKDFAIGTYANDAAAAQGGVALGQLYVETSTQYVKSRAM